MSDVSLDSGQSTSALGNGEIAADLLSSADSRSRCGEAPLRLRRLRGCTRASASFPRVSGSSHAAGGASTGHPASFYGDRVLLGLGWHPAERVFASVCEGEGDRLSEALSGPLSRALSLVRPWPFAPGISGE